MRNIFAHIITTLIGIAFMLFALAVALISYDDSGVIDYRNTIILSAIGLFLLFAKDDLINTLLNAIIKKFVK
jgi:hypothetical protein